MARYTCEVYKDTGNVLLTDVQNVVVNTGRIQIQDPFRGSTATISGRNPQNLPALEIGTNVYIQILRSPSYGSFVYFGKITNIEVLYGEVANMDTWTIQLEDALALAGRTITSNTFSWSAGIRTDAAASLAGVDAGVPVYNYWQTLSYTPQGQSFVSAQSLPNSNLLAVLNQLATTEQGRMISAGYDQVGWINRSDLGQNAFVTSFTDGSLSATYAVTKYNEIRFASLGDSSYTKATVEPEGLAAQTRGAGVRDFVAKSYDQTTTQAQNLADYILATLDVNTAAPLTISCISEVQVNDALIDAFQTTQFGNKAELILRGQRYNLFLNGATLTATPEQVRVTFNVVSSEAQNFFILDSATFGVLDQNRLGF